MQTRATNLASRQRESYVLRQTPITVGKGYRQAGHRQCTPESVPCEGASSVHFRIAGEDTLTVIHEGGGAKKSGLQALVSRVRTNVANTLRRAPVPEHTALIRNFIRGEREQWLYLIPAVVDGQLEEMGGRGCCGHREPKLAVVEHVRARFCTFRISYNDMNGRWWGNREWMVAERSARLS